MKKILLMAVAALFAFTANAGDKVHVMPYFGLGYAHLSNNGDWCDQAAAQIGVDVEFMVSEKFGISIGANYLNSATSDKEFNGSLNGVSCNFKAHEKYGFLNIPVMAQYHLGGWAFKAGLQPELLISAKNSIDGSISVTSSNVWAWIPAYNDGSIKDYYHNVALALPVGVSYSFRRPWTLDLRCAIPLTKLSNDKLSSSQRYMTVMFSAGYRF